MENQSTRKRRNRTVETAEIAADDNKTNNETQPPEKLLKISQCPDVDVSEINATNNVEMNVLDYSTKTAKNVNNNGMISQTPKEAITSNENASNNLPSCSNISLIEESSIKRETSTSKDEVNHIKNDVIVVKVELDNIKQELNDLKIEQRIEKEDVFIKKEPGIAISQLRVESKVPTKIEVTTVTNQTDKETVITNKPSIKSETSEEILIENNSLINDKHVDELQNPNDINSCDNLKDVVTIKFGSLYVSSILKESIRDALMKVKDIMIFEKGDNLVVAPVDTKCKKKRKRCEKKSKDSLFMVDTTPSLSQEKTQFRYSCKFSLDNSEKSGDFHRKESISSCFNCSEPHNLRDCPHPKDFIRINKAKTRISKGV